jgi:rsbT co-antagonist protein RsbR
MIDTQNRYRMVNRHQANALGSTPAAMIGQPMADFLPAIMVEQWQTLREQVIASRAPLEYEHEVDVSGEPRQFVSVIFPLFDEQEQIYALAGISTDISEQKRAEHDLRVIFDNVSDAIFIHTLDESGTILEVNQSMLNMYGVDRETALALKVPAFSSPSNDMDMAGAMLGRAIADEVPTFAWRARRPLDETEFDVEVTLRRVDFQQQSCILATVRDITIERRQAAEREAQAQWLRHIMDAFPDGMFVMEQGYVIDANLAAADMLGYTLETLVGIPVLNLIAPESHAVVREQMQQAFAHHYEALALRQDGSTLTVEISARSIDLQGRQPRIAVVRDITERKQQQEEVRVYQQVVAQALDGIAMVDFNGVITYANAAYNRMLGYDSAIGLTNAAVTHPDDIDRVAAVGQAVMQHGAYQGAYRYQRKDGSTFPAQLSVFLINDISDAPVFAAAIMRDISDQVAAEAERAALQQQVIDAQRATLRELSSPLIPISDDVVIMPLIGAIDSHRAQQVLETLLEGVAAHHAHTVILDITGVQVVDTQVANAFIQAARAVRLLGAEVMLTGIQPQIAQTLVQLGVDLSDIDTRGSLQAGIAAVLR